MDYTVAELSENAIFVQILSNYPNMFKRPTTKTERTRQEYARYALTHTFNEKCKTNLSIKQISRKINNMKARLKDKSVRHSIGIKHVKYHDWEELFLRLWTGSETNSQLQDDGTENMETNLNTMLNPSDGDIFNSTDLLNKTSTKSPTTIVEASDIELKIEPHFNSIKEEDEIESISDISSTPYWHVEPEQNTEPPPVVQFNGIHNENTENLTESPTEVQFNAIYNEESRKKTDPPTKEVQFNDIHNEDEQYYDKMTTDELKRIALISQTKMFKAQEAAARAKEKLNLYKLMILKRENGHSFHK